MTLIAMSTHGNEQPAVQPKLDGCYAFNLNTVAIAQLHPYDCTQSRLDERTL